MSAFARTRRLVVLSSLLAAFAVALLALPAPARADDYDVTRVNIQAQVHADGSMTVVERRTFAFDEDINGVYWTIPLDCNQQGEQVSLPQIQVSEEGGAAGAYRQVDYASPGDTGVYTAEADISELTIKVFTPHEDGDTSTITLTYIMTGAVMSWADTAELYWKFIGDGWTEDSQNVELAISFDDAAAEDAVTGTDNANFRAWGHGPLNGDVSLDADTATVAYKVPRVQSGEYAEARVAFPRAWVSGLTGSGDERLPQILDEEQAWADETNARREQERAMRIAVTMGCVALPAIFAAAVLVAKKLAGPKPRPVFEDTYFRDVPSYDHPAVIAAFMRGGTVDNRAAVATLMKLVDDKHARIEPISRTRKKLFGEKVEEDYRLSIEAGILATLPDKIDRAALGLYLWDGEVSISFDEMGELAGTSPKRYAKRWEAFTDAVDEQLAARDLVASSGVAAGALASTVGGLLFFACIMGTVVFETSVIAMLAGLALCAAGIALGWTFKRLTPEGAELKARCDALRCWFEDFTRLGEAVPGDVVLWNKLLVLAVALGVSERVLEDLAAATPHEYNDYYDDYYCPSWWWFYHRNIHVGTPFSAMDHVHELSHAAIAKSSNSSGGGFGGGFSGGGGGGVGGGGGGTF